MRATKIFKNILMVILVVAVAMRHLCGLSIYSLFKQA